MAVQDGFGKVSGSESLVFAYDLKDTINSYKGEPTTNYFASFGVAMPNLSGANVTTTLPDGTTGTVFRVTVNSNSNTSRCSMGINLPNQIPQANVSYTISHWIRTTGTVPVAAGWEAEVSFPDGYARPSFESGYIGDYGSLVQPNNISSTWQRVSYTYSYSTTKTSNITPFIYFGSPIGGTQDTIGATIDFYGFQFEVNSHSTPYTTTSRSNTQGLLDLTGNNSIDLSNVSFDSNAKMVFDGTNDYIGFGDVSGNIGGKSQATMELILKINALKSNDLQEVFGFRNNSNFDFYMIILPSENSGLTEFRVRNSSGTYYDLNPNINSYIGNYVHIMFSVGSGGRKVYFNGSLVGSSPTWTGSFGATSPFSVGNYLAGMIWSVLGEIPVAKLYDRELSSTEITNNYLKYKRQYGLT
jgi:hypothetical protein